MADACFPVIRTEVDVGSLLPSLQAPRADVEYNEVYSAPDVVQYVRSPSMVHNAEVASTYFSSKVKACSRSRRGRVSTSAEAELKEWARLEQKSKAHEATMQRLLEAVGTSLHSDVPLSQRDMEIVREVRYRYPNDWRGRRVVCEHGYQSMPKRALWSVCPPELQDWDIKSAMWTIVSQLVRKLGVRLNVPAAKFSSKPKPAVTRTRITAARCTLDNSSRASRSCNMTAKSSQRSTDLSR